MRILLAEDDRDLCRAVKTLLERSGYVVDAVDNGADAVEYATAEAYDGLVASTPARTTTCPSPSTPPSCWRACAPCSGAGTAMCPTSPFLKT